MVCVLRVHKWIGLKIDRDLRLIICPHASGNEQSKNGIAESLILKVSCHATPRPRYLLMLIRYIRYNNTSYSQPIPIPVPNSKICNKPGCNDRPTKTVWRTVHDKYKNMRRCGGWCEGRGGGSGCWGGGGWWSMRRWRKWFALPGMRMKKPMNQWGSVNVGSYDDST